MRGWAALLARGIWWRRGAALVLVLCATVTVGAAAAGPLWGRAAQASLLQRSLQDAAVEDVAWTANGSTDDYGGLVYPAPQAREVSYDVRDESALPPALDRLFDGPTEMISSARRLKVEPLPAEPPADAPAPGAEVPDPPLGRLLAREGACEQVEIVAGACPTTRTGLLFSDRSAQELGIVPGDQVRLPELNAERPRPREPEQGVYDVAGIYRAEGVETSSRFWFDSDDFDYAPPASFGGETIPARLDAVLAPVDLVMSVRSVPVRVQRERVLLPGAVRLGSADRVARQLTARSGEIAATSRTTATTATAAATLSGSAGGRRLVADTATFVGLQVVVFGWVVLFGLVAVSVAARDAELALAKLRGLRGRRLAAHALTEPVALVLLAVPLGLLSAWAVVAALAGRVLLPGTRVIAPEETWWVVGGTVAGSVLACVLAARRSVRMPVADQLRRQAPAAGTAGPVVTAVLLTLAAVGLVLVLTLGRGAQSALPALLTPVVVGLAAGLIAGAAVQLLMRAAAARTRRWPLGPYLAVRQLARQASMTHVTALVTVATAVSGFAAGAYVVTANQRASQARFDVGADRVVHVAPGGVRDLLAAVDQADPQRAWAMAALQRGDGPNALLAVDSARFGAAFAVPGGALAAPGALSALVPDRIPEPLVVRGTTATIEVAASYLYSVRPIDLGVQLRYVTPDGEPAAVVLGRLDAEGGARTLTAPVPECAEGCTIASILLRRTAGVGDISGSVELVRLDVGGRSYPIAEADWRPSRLDETVPDSVQASTVGPRDGNLDGVTIRFDAAASVAPGMVRRDVPAELPAIVASQTQLYLIGVRELVGGTTLEGGTIPYEIVGRTPVVPRAEGGSIVDLGLVARLGPPRGADLDQQVWLGPAAPADAPQRLAAAGLEVRDVESLTARRDQLDRAETARAQLLLLGAAAAVLLAGVAGIATVLAASARRRSVEAAALHAMAVPGRVVRGSAVLEQVLLLLPGVLVGAGCAAVLVRVLTPVLAEVSGASAAVSGPPAALDVALPVLAAALVTALLLVPVVLAVTRPAGAETPLRVAA